MNSKEKCLAVLNGRPTELVPVFPLLMFFSANRAGITYRQFVTNSSAMAEAQLKVREQFGIDAFTACSDALVSADLGGEMVYPEDNSPYLAKPIVRNEEDLNRLSRPDPSKAGTRMAGRIRATYEMVKAVGDECLVLGWVDMPFAEACSVCGVSEFMMMLYDNPKLAHSVLEFLTEIVIDFCLVQFL